MELAHGPLLRKPSYTVRKPWGDSPQPIMARHRDGEKYDKSVVEDNGVTPWSTHLSTVGSVSPKFCQKICDTAQVESTL